jgi:hypothetical protein
MDATSFCSADPVTGERHAMLISVVKGIVRLSTPMTNLPYLTHILNYAFGRYELTPMSELDDKEEFRGVGLRLTVMGERGEVARRARRLGEALGEGVQVA